MDPATVLGFAAASLALIAVPGPSVLFAISRALVGGRRDALLTVLGNSAGLFAQVVAVTVGLGVILGRDSAVQSALSVGGAAYLALLGIGAIRRRELVVRPHSATVGHRSMAPLRDGFIIGASNPKSLLFLAALLPGFVDEGAASAGQQMLALGALFCLIALLSDGAWAVAAARARDALSERPQRLRWASVAGGTLMIVLALLVLLGGTGR
jgi:threonine/homoserine/homoserine lactone efflux protein